MAEGSLPSGWPCEFTNAQSHFTVTVILQLRVRILQTHDLVLAETLALRFKSGMKFTASFLTFTFLALICLISVHGEDTPGAKKSTALFNGHDLAGWRLFTTNNASVEDFCSVTNGVLTFKGKPIGYVRTENVYSNFHLHLRFRWMADLPRNNSGVFIQVAKSDAIWPDCVQCQVKNGSTGELFGTGSIQFDAPVIKGKKVVQIAGNSEKPSGEWNDYDIYTSGNRVETKVNGKLGASGTCNASVGAIALQAEGFGIEFKEIELGELPETFRFAESGIQQIQNTTNQ